MDYNKHDVIKFIESGQYPFDLLYSIYEERRNKNKPKLSETTFKIMLNKFIQFGGDVTPAIISKYEINILFDDENRIIKYL